MELYVARMGHMRRAYKILGGKPKLRNLLVDVSVVEKRESNNNNLQLSLYVYSVYVCIHGNSE
jgi:hypothetical protein